MSMSVTGAPERRVRHQAQDALLVMVFSAALSAGLAGLLLLITILGRQG